MTPSTFAERFGYTLWLYHLVNAKPVGFAAIGKAIGRTGEAVAGWLTAKNTPAVEVHEATAALLGVDERWLFRGTGEAPRPHLWREWVAVRHAEARPDYLRIAEEFNLPVAGGPPTVAKKLAPRKRADGSK